MFYQYFSQVTKAFLQCCACTHLIAPAARATGLAGLLAVDVVSGEEGVGWTLLALVGVFVYIVARGAGHAGRAALLTHHGAGVAGRGRAVQSIRDFDRVDLHYVIHIPAHLIKRQTESGREDTVLVRMETVRAAR